MSIISTTSASSAPGGALERVEVHAHEIDPLDLLRLRGLGVLRIVAHPQQPGVELGMERLDPPVHDLGEAGEVGDRARGDLRLGQHLGGASGGDDLDPELGEPTGEVDDAGLVRDGYQRATNGDLAGLRRRRGELGRVPHAREHT